MEMVELLVRMDCAGCERTVRKALRKLKGVDTVDVDLKQCKVTVTGNVDPKKVLKAVRKSGKRAEFWPDFSSYDGGLTNSQLAVSSYIKHGPAFAKTYNYKKHGYNSGSGSGSSNSYYAAATDSAHLSADAHLPPPNYASTLFSDENPNNCSIM